MGQVEETSGAGPTGDIVPPVGLLSVAPGPLRFGGYVVEGVLVEVPGARFFRARAADGERVLVQAVDLRAPRDEAERATRNRLEKTIGARTAELIASKETPIRAHGGVDRGGDERTVFWVLGVPPDARPVDLEDRVGAARAFARALDELHARGLSAPLLAREIVLLRTDRRAEIIQVPILVEGDWITPPSRAWAPAPGEQDRATVEGDVYRLGRVLGEAGAELSSLQAWRERLTALDPGRRPQTARAALVLLEALLLGSLDPQTTSPGLETSRGPSGPFGLDVSEVQTSIDSFHPLDGGPGLDGAASLAGGLGLDNSLGLDGGLGLGRGLGLEGGHGLAPPIFQPIAAVAAAWAPTLLPEGASPWSEVVTARATDSGRPSFTGFPGELPQLSEGDVPEGPAPPPPAPALLQRPSVPAPPAREEPPASEARARLIHELSPHRAALGISLVLVAFGLVAYGVRGRPEPIAALPSLLATPANDVTLASEPSGVWVVSELDGRVLGQTPLQFLVPPSTEAVVLLTQEGLEPVRVSLPDRGSVSVRLPRATDPHPCRVEVPAGAEVELVGTRFDAEQRVVGAGVVRAVRSDHAGGPYVGARIVRCEADVESVRFDRWAGSRTVRVSAPPGAEGWLDGDPLGVLPGQGTTRHAFSRVRIGGGLERWVPTMSDVELRMPAEARGAAEVAAPEEVLEPPSLASREAPPPTRARPSTALGHLRSGTELLARGELDRAELELRACLRSNPRVSSCHRALGDVLRRRDESAEASAAYRRYLELEPDAPDAALVRRLMRDGRR